MEYIKGYLLNLRELVEQDHGVASATINSIKEKRQAAIIAGNSKKLMSSVKQVIRKRGINVANSSRSGKRSLRTRLSGDNIGGGFMSFTADYHSPRHHPPKNNK